MACAFVLPHWRPGLLLPSWFNWGMSR